MRVMITGHQGQLGRALHRLRPDAHGVSRAEMDVTESAAVESVVHTLKPELIVHCAAWTDVDGAARQPDQAYRVNALGTQHLAQSAEKVGATLVYLSTNEVFDGAKTSPYCETDRANPINAYGISKAVGETIVQQTLAHWFIVRVSWLTAPSGRGFVQRIQQLADERGALQVVTDEVACPTFVHDLAPAIWRLIDTAPFGIYHLTNQGYCSRFEFARVILAATQRGHIPVTPITRAQFQRASMPPAFTPLANIAAAAVGITLPAWQDALQVFLSAQT